MSVISGTIGAIMGSAAQKDANQKNLQAVQETNAANLRMFQESRGSGGNALLPLYFGGYEGSTLAPAAKAAFAGAYPTTPGALATRMSELERIQQQFAPAFQSASDTVDDIFSGKMTRDRLGEAAPVARARTTAGATSKAAIINGLKERLNAISAGRRTGGYTGAGSGTEGSLLRATIGGRDAAAQAEAQASLSNELMFQGVKDQGRSLALSNLDLPTVQAQRAGQFSNLPAETLTNQYLQAMRPFSYFNINPQAFKNEAAPQIAPVAGVGQALAAGIGSANTSLANYFANRSLANTYGSAAGNAALGRYGVGAPDNWNSLTAAQQAGYISAAAGNAAATGIYE